MPLGTCRSDDPGRDLPVENCRDIRLAHDGRSVTRTISLPWYSRENYPRILALVADRHNLASTYDQWLMVAENNELVARQAGLEITRVMIEPDAFARWCAQKGVAPDSAARMAYVSAQAAPGKDA